LTPSCAQIIAVFGATGLQGGSVINALLEQDVFTVRAITRDAKKNGRALSSFGAVEIFEANLDDEASLLKALDGAYGVFLVTNFWEPTSDGVSGPHEYAQAVSAVQAAKKACVHHLVWSTLPHIHRLSDGKQEAKHFDKKAEVDEIVKAAGFPHSSFIYAPMYFENFLEGKPMAPRLADDGVTHILGPFPIPASCKRIHMGSVNDLGTVVAGAFAHPELTGDLQYLAYYAEAMSFEEMVTTLRSLGLQVNYVECSPEEFSSFPIPHASDLAAAFQFMHDYEFGYMGPRGHSAKELALKVSTAPTSTFATWARANMVPALGRQSPEAQLSIAEYSELHGIRGALMAAVTAAFTARVGDPINFIADHLKSQRRARDKVN